MTHTLDLLPDAVWITCAALHVLTFLSAQKEMPMSESPISTAGADSTLTAALPDPTAAAAAFAQHPVTTAVVQAVQADPNVPPHGAAAVAASILSALMPLISPALQVSRASPRTSAEVALGFAALSAILEVFHPHPALSA